MNGKSLALSATPPPPLRVRRPEKYDEGETFRNDTQKERELQIISTSTFTLPDDWIVEEKPRPYTTGRYTHIDKYYYEPGTGRKFRSLISVKRYLYGEEREVLSTERMKSENESASLQKSGRGKKRATGKNCSLKASSNCSTVADEDGVTLKTMKLAIHSQEKINLGKVGKASILESSNPPEKVNWVLSGPGGAWRPFLNNSEVPESVKLKWSEAFFGSINAGDRVAPNFGGGGKISCKI